MTPFNKISIKAIKKPLTKNTHLKVERKPQPVQNVKITPSATKPAAILTKKLKKNKTGLAWQFPPETNVRDSRRTSS